jgi:serine protease Do
LSPKQKTEAKALVASHIAGQRKGALKIAALGALAILFAMAMAQKVLAHGAPDSFADLAEALLPSVVNIQTVQGDSGEEEVRQVPDLPPGSPFQEFFDDFLNQDQEQDQPRRRGVSVGSGFFLSSDGYVLTNNHVIGEAIEISVTTMDGEEYEAELVGRDAELDVALLKVDADREFTAISWGDSTNIRVGEWVMSIGNPFGLGGSVTAGIVSARNRNINAGAFDDFIQTDASINRGNSGGPLFNMEGEVIGMNTMIFTPNGGNIGIGFSIPSNDVARTSDQLLEFGRPRRGWIGVSVQSVNEEMAEALQLPRTTGAIVGSVNDDGPAEKAGLEAGDIIIVFNGIEIGDVSELVRAVSETGVDRDASVQFIRNGEEMETTLVTTERNPDPEVVAEAETAPDPLQASNGTVLGMRVSPLTASLREQYDVPEEVNGLVISNLSRRSNAAESGIRPGDIIVQVNQQKVTELEEIEGTVVSAVESGRRNVLLRIYRGGSYFMVPVSVSEAG